MVKGEQTMRIVITAALLMALPLSAFAQPRPRATAVAPQADGPRILEAAARLAAETRLQERDRGERRTIQRIPLPAQIAMVAGGSALFYMTLRGYGDCGCSSAIWGMTGSGTAVALGTGLMLQ